MLIEDVQQGPLRDPRVPDAAHRAPVRTSARAARRQRAGKIWVDMTGGTEGPVKVMEKLGRQRASARSSACTWGPSCARRPRSTTSTWSSPATSRATRWASTCSWTSSSARASTIIPTSGLIRVHRDAKGRSRGPGAAGLISTRRLDSSAPSAAPRWVMTWRHVSSSGAGRRRRALRRPCRPAPTPSTSASSAGARAPSPATSPPPSCRRRRPRPPLRRARCTWRSTRCSRTTSSSRRSPRWRRRTPPVSTRSSSPTSASRPGPRALPRSRAARQHAARTRTRRRSSSGSRVSASRRAILARELSLSEIAALDAHGLDLEVFVHGALCYGYSGDCLLSSMIGGRSGNRGRCSQSCRMSYRLRAVGRPPSEAHGRGRRRRRPAAGSGPRALSTADLCAIAGPAAADRRRRDARSRSRGA